MLSNIQKLTIAMLMDGHRFRAHQRQICAYEDASWVRVEAREVKSWSTLMAAEGLFISLAVHQEKVRDPMVLNRGRHLHRRDPRPHGRNR